MHEKFYITTPIYYVNDVPHIGHAYTSIASDVIARFKSLEGNEVMFITGTDEHGQKVEKSAAVKNMTPQKFTDLMSESFRKLITKANISSNDFIRTTEERHKKFASIFWQKLMENGDLYLGKYSGWYAVRDEAFYSEAELTPEGLAPTGAPVEWVEEPSYFFALSKWQDKLLEFYENNPGFIRPESRRNEVISFVKNGLMDLSVSRTSFKWGIPVPNDNEHIMYVWVEALSVYISVLGFSSDLYQKFWPADVHVVGKDIVRFHAVYWPAFLMAAGINLPKCIMAHGWWTNEGQKISKSLGNVIDPFQLIDEFGLDQVRYFLMREVTFGNDGNFSKENLINRTNSELANKIGNLLQRTLSFISKNCEAKIPAVSKEFLDNFHEIPILRMANRIVVANSEHMKRFELNNILDNIISLAEEANSYIDHEGPWQLKTTNPQRMLEVMYTLTDVLRYIAIMLLPFVPSSAEKMLDQLAVSKDHRKFEHLQKNFAATPGMQILEPYPVFPKFVL